MRNEDSFKIFFQPASASRKEKHIEILCDIEKHTTLEPFENLV